jgi:CBS-domain-containing membrane protein
MLGNTVSAILAVGITKLFRLSSSFTIGSVYGSEWACGAICMATSLAVMEAFGITHPPGGATALLAGVLPAVINLGWVGLC